MARKRCRQEPPPRQNPSQRSLWLAAKNPCLQNTIRPNPSQPLFSTALFAALAHPLRFSPRARGRTPASTQAHFSTRHQKFFANQLSPSALFRNRRTAFSPHDLPFVRERVYLKKHRVAGSRRALLPSPIRNPSPSKKRRLFCLFFLLCL